MRTCFFMSSDDRATRAYDAGSIARTAAASFGGPRPEHVGAILLAHADRRMRDATDYAAIAPYENSEGMIAA